MLVLSLKPKLIEGLVLIGEGAGVLHPVDLRSSYVRTGITCSPGINLLRVKVVLQIVERELEIYDDRQSNELPSISDRERQLCEEVHALLLQDVHDETDTDRFYALLNEPEMTDLLSGEEAKG